MHHCPDRELTEMSVCRKVGPLLSWMDGPLLKAFVTWTSIRKKWMFIIHLFPLSLPTSILTFPRSATYPNCLRHDRWLAWNQPSKYCFQFFPLFHHFIQLPPFLSSPPLSSSPSIHPSLILQTGEMTVHCFVLLFFFHLLSLRLSFLRASQLILLVSSKHSHPITWRAHPGNGFKEGLLYSSRTVTSTGPPFPWVIECDVIIRPVTWTFWPGDLREEPMLLFLSEELGTCNLRYFITCVHVQPDGQRGHLWVGSNVKSGPWAKFS